MENKMTKTVPIASSYGSVRLDAFMADDLSVVNSARVSFDKHSSELDSAGIGLINFLMRERHGTPFEHNSFRFHVKCPIFVAREWFRHRIGSFNEFSARYSEMPPEFYVPTSENVRTQKGKPGAYVFEPITDETLRESARKAISLNIEQSIRTYEMLIQGGVAKELARSVLPVAMYTQFFWTVNARSLMNFLSLRTASAAQLEIREYADDIERLFEDKMPITYAAWIANGKMTP
jgi:thymidylate synthase (FAD)